MPRYRQRLRRRRSSKQLFNRCRFRRRLPPSSLLFLQLRQLPLLLLLISQLSQLSRTS